MSENGYRPTIAEIKNHTESKREEAKNRIAQNKSQNSLKTKIALGVAALAVAAGIRPGTEVQKAAAEDIPNRTPEVTAPQNPEGYDKDEFIKEAVAGMEEQEQKAAAIEALKERDEIEAKAEIEKYQKMLAPNNKGE